MIEGGDRIVVQPHPRLGRRWEEKMPQAALSLREYLPGVHHVKPLRGTGREELGSEGELEGFEDGKGFVLFRRCEYEVKRGLAFQIVHVF